MMDTRIVDIPILKVQPNTGQVAGLPSNPRKKDPTKFELPKANIADYPEMLEYRRLLVYPHSGKYVIIGGNMRYAAMAELGFSEVPCVVIPENTPVERLRAYTILDNGEFGKWDWDLLAAFDADDLKGWGMDMNFEGMDDNAPVEERKRAAWNSAEDAKESVCDMKEHLALYRRDDLLFTAFFKKSEEGVPLSLIKSKENVDLFVSEAVRVLKGLAGFGSPLGWCLVTAPRRRHKDWNFGDVCCQGIAGQLGIPYYPDVFEAKNRNRIRPEFHLLKEIAEPNVVVFDDILTTGSTLRAMAALLGGKNTMFVVGINNN